MKWPFRKTAPRDPWEEWGISEDGRALIEWVQRMGFDTALRTLFQQLASPLASALHRTPETRQGAAELTAITCAMLVLTAQRCKRHRTDREGLRLVGRYFSARPEMLAVPMETGNRPSDPEALENYNSLMAQIAATMKQQTEREA